MSSSPNTAYWVSRSTKPAGFTLLELLIALFILSILSLVSYQLIRNQTQVLSAVKKNILYNSQTNFALTQLNQDFRQQIHRSVRNTEGTDSSVRGDSENIHFTRHGWTNLGEERRSELQRINYKYNEKTGLLQRRYTRHVDTNRHNENFWQTIHEGISYFRFDYFDNTGALHNQWPLDTATNTHMGSPDKTSKIEGALGIPPHIKNTPYLTFVRINFISNSTGEFSYYYSINPSFNEVTQPTKTRSFDP